MNLRLRWAAIAAMLLASLASCRTDETVRHRTHLNERDSRTAVGQMNPGDWPQSETGTPGTGIPPLR